MKDPSMRLLHHKGSNRHINIENQCKLCIMVWYYLIDADGHSIKPNSQFLKFLINPALATRFKIHRKSTRYKNFMQVWNLDYIKITKFRRNQEISQWCWIHIERKTGPTGLLIFMNTKKSILVYLSGVLGFWGFGVLGFWV